MKFPLFNMKRSLVAHLLMLFACVLTLSSFAAAQKRSVDVVLAPEAESLQQCANGGRGSAELPCADGNWQFGNLNRNNSQWVEGEYVPYRIVLTGLVPNSTGNQVTINYGTTENGKHAIDYLGTWNQSLQSPNGPGGEDACVNVTPCTPGIDALIPVDPNVAANSNPDVIMPADGRFKIWNGNITGVSGYTVSGTYADTSTTSITITFTALTDTVVIAYGGHISTRVDWTINGSAISINGSPYHSNINGGANRSLSVAATIYPAFVVIIKEVRTLTQGTTATFGFNFTYTPAGGTPFLFTLTDDVVGDGGGGTTIPTLDPDATQVFQIASFTDVAPNQTAAVTEAVYPQWTLSSILCTEQSGGLPNLTDTTTSLGGRTANISAQEAEVIVCTFRNTQSAPTAAPASISGRTVDSFGNGVGNTRVTVTDAQSGQTYFAITNPFGYYTIEGPSVGNFYIMTVSNKRYTFADDLRSFTLNDNLFDVDFVANP